MRDKILYPFRLNTSADWTAFSNDTTNLAYTNLHISKVGGLTFDKANGTGDLKYAGIYRSDLALDLTSEPRDLCPEDRIGICFYVGALTNIASLHIRLGTSASHYCQWAIADTVMTASTFQVHTAKLGACTVTGSGWNPASISYAALLINFDAETNALAGNIIDSVWFQKNTPTVA